MPRALPRFDLQFAGSVAAALDLVSRIEQINAYASARRQPSLTSLQVELSYELAYLRIFIAWEVLLEQTFTRFVCGYTHSGGQEPISGTQRYFGTLELAERSILGNRNYILWHNPNQVISRAQAYLTNSRYELVISSAQVRIGHFAAIRHRIAHAQTHAALEFDNATTALAGRRYRGARPGRFLRDRTPNAQPPRRWLNTIGSDLTTLASQICN
jgi:hypothetical protein